MSEDLPSQPQHYEPAPGGSPPTYDELLLRAADDLSLQMLQPHIVERMAAVNSEVQSPGGQPEETHAPQTPERPDIPDHETGRSFEISPEHHQTHVDLVRSVAPTEVDSMPPSVQDQLGEAVEIGRDALEGDGVSAPEVSADTNTGEYDPDLAESLASVNAKYDNATAGIRAAVERFEKSFDADPTAAQLAARSRLLQNIDNIEAARASAISWARERSRQQQLETTSLARESQLRARLTGSAAETADSQPRNDNETAAIPPGEHVQRLAGLLKELESEPGAHGLPEYKVVAEHMDIATQDVRQALLGASVQGESIDAATASELLPMVTNLVECQKAVDKLRFDVTPIDQYKVKTMLRDKKGTRGDTESSGVLSPNEAGLPDYLGTIMQPGEGDLSSVSLVAREYNGAASRTSAVMLDRMKAISRYCEESGASNVAANVLGNIKDDGDAAYCLYQACKGDYGANMLAWEGVGQIDPVIKQRLDEREWFYAEAAELSHKGSYEVFSYKELESRDAVENMVLADTMGLSPGLVSGLKEVMRESVKNGVAFENQLMRMSLKDILKHDPEQMNTLHEKFGIVNFNRYSSNQLDKMYKIAQKDPQLLEKLSNSKRVRVLMMDSLVDSSGVFHSLADKVETAWPDDDVVFTETSSPEGYDEVLKELAQLGINPSSAVVGAHAVPGTLLHGDSLEIHQGSEGSAVLTDTLDRHLQPDENGERHVVFISCSLAKPVSEGKSSFVEDVAKETDLITWGASSDPTILNTAEGDLMFGYDEAGARIPVERYQRLPDGTVQHDQTAYVNSPRESAEKRAA